MPSILTAFEYDIFMSYRHNDNLDGWVSDFVQNLEKELRGTLKETLTIYFDKNPHDGLLETHNVDKSLEGKLKCLIFIPIISQTYCDPKSFAWQHEFVAFNKLSKEDQFGRDIKLSNGNVSSRILPIKIHDLDADDKAIIENEIGGVLRAIDFIYKEAGVNRPLLKTDLKNDNQNKTDYRNQVNKVALAIKELLNSISRPVLQQTVNNKIPAPEKPNKKIIISILSVFCLLVAAGSYYWYSLSANNFKEDFNPILDRAEQYFEESERFNDKRYFEQALQAIQKVLAIDSLNERALYLLVGFGSELDSNQYVTNKLLRVAPNGIYASLTKAGQLIERNKTDSAKEVLLRVLEKNQKNKGALIMITYLSLTTQEYLNCYRYARLLEPIDPKRAYGMLTRLYLELGDFKEAYRQLQLKQNLQEFVCSDIEDFQRILLCEGNFEKLEQVTDSLCNFSKCTNCSFWQLRSKLHSGKYDEAAKWVKPSLLQMPKITWRYPAFVLLKNGKTDSSNLIANEELLYDKDKLGDKTYNQTMPLYSMAAIHAMQGNTKESLNYLKQYASEGFEMGSEWYIAHDPLFDDLQKDNEFFADFLQIFQKEQQRKMSIREELRNLEK